MESENDWNYYHKYFQQEYGEEDEGETLEALLRLPSVLGIDEIPVDFHSDRVEEEEEMLDIDDIPISEKTSFEQLDTTSLLKGVSQQRIGREIVGVVSAGGEEEEIEKPDESVLQLFEKKEAEDIDFGAQIIDEIGGAPSEDDMLEQYRTFEEEQESEESRITEVEVPLDREALFEEYASLINERYIARRRNYLLKRRLAEHFKRRHMEHAYKETAFQADLEDRYERKLIAFRELDSETTETKIMINDQVQELTSQKTKAKEETKQKFEELLDRELEVGLMIAQQSSGISDTTVKTLVNYKRTKAWELSKIRLTSIKYKEKIKEAENKRLVLESIGPDLRLMDYEEMQIEFSNFMDKIDERIEQMVRIREKVRGDVQIMAHMRERYFAQNNDILDLENALTDADNEITTLRKKVNKLIRIRGDHQYQTLCLKDESGLLTYNNLLRDFQKTLNEIDQVTINLYLIQKTYQEQKPLLMASRQAVDALKSVSNII